VLAKKKSGRSEAADSSAHHHAIVEFTGIGGVFLRMRLGSNRVVCGPRRELPKYCHCCWRIRRRRRSRSSRRLRREERRWLLGEKLSGRKRMEQLRAGSEQGRAEKVAAGNGRLHAQRGVRWFVEAAGHIKIYGQDGRINPLLQNRPLLFGVQRMMAFFVKFVLEFEAVVVRFYGTDGFFDGVNPGFYAGFAQFLGGYSSHRQNSDSGKRAYHQIAGVRQFWGVGRASDRHRILD